MRRYTLRREQSRVLFTNKKRKEKAMHEEDCCTNTSFDLVRTLTVRSKVTSQRWSGCWQQVTACWARSTSTPRASRTNARSCRFRGTTFWRSPRTARRILTSPCRLRRWENVRQGSRDAKGITVQKGNWSTPRGSRYRKVITVHKGDQGTQRGSGYTSGIKVCKGDQGAPVPMGSRYTRGIKVQKRIKVQEED